MRSSLHGPLFLGAGLGYYELCADASLPLLWYFAVLLLVWALVGSLKTDTVVQETLYNLQKISSDSALLIQLALPVVTSLTSPSVTHRYPPFHVQEHLCRFASAY